MAIHAEVTRGAALLESMAASGNHPWLDNMYNRVDIDKLDMLDSANCVIGQLHPVGFGAGMAEISAFVAPNFAPRSFGSHTPSWRALIMERRTGLTVGSKWTRHQRNPGVRVEIKHLWSQGDAHFVIWQWEDGDTPILHDRDRFLADFKPYVELPVYVHGDVIRDDAGRT